MKMNKVNLRRGNFSLPSEEWGNSSANLYSLYVMGEVLITECHSKFSLKSIVGFAFIDYDGCGNSSVQIEIGKSSICIRSYEQQPDTAGKKSE